MGEWTGCTVCKGVTNSIDGICTPCKIIAERDRLAAELAAANAAYAQLVIDYEQVLDDLTESDATLDKLREVFDRICKGNEMSEAIDDMDAILYPTLEKKDESQGSE